MYMWGWGREGQVPNYRDVGHRDFKKVSQVSKAVMPCLECRWDFLRQDKHPSSKIAFIQYVPPQILEGVLDVAFAMLE